MCLYTDDHRFSDRQNIYINQVIRKNLLDVNPITDLRLITCQTTRQHFNNQLLAK